MKKDAIIYREATLGDIPCLIDLEKEVWGEEMLAGAEKWESRIKLFPEGNILAEHQNRIIGVIVGMFIKWEYANGFYPDWFEVTDNGFITRHDYSGDVLYGVDMTVLPKSYQAANVLLASVFELRKRFNKSGGVMGSRIPSLRDFVVKNKITTVSEEIVSMVAEVDPTVNFFIRGGFKWVGPKRDYFSPDSESLGWGLILDHF